jgi:hypothetical protein
MPQAAAVNKEKYEGRSMKDEAGTGKRRPLAIFILPPSYFILSLTLPPPTGQKHTIFLSTEISVIIHK